MANVSLNIIFSAVDRNVRAIMGGIGKGLEGMTSKMMTAGGVMMASGGAITGAIGLMARDAANYGEEINKAAKMTGLSAEAVSKLRFAGEQSEVSFEGMTKALARMMRTAVGSPAKFAEIGVSVRDASGALKDGEALFLDVVSALGQIENPTLKAAMAMQIFGRDGSAMLPLIGEGAAGIKAMGERAKELGIVLSDDAAKAGDDFNDTVAETKLAVRGMAVSLGTTLLPVLTDVARTIANATAWFRRLSDEHPTLAKGLLYVAGGFGLIGTTAGPLLMFIAQTLPLWSKLAGMKGLGGIAAAATQGATGLSGLGSGLWAMASAAGPIMAVVAALAVMMISLERTYGMWESLNEEMTAALDKSKQVEASVMHAAMTRGGPAAQREAMRQQEELSQVRAAGGFMSWSRIKQALMAGWSPEGRANVPTLGEMATGWVTGEGVTGWDLARVRRFSAMQNPLTVNVYIGDEPIKAEAIRVQRDTDRRAAHGAWR